MVDWKKEVKLSDLFGRKQKDEKTPVQAEPESEAAPEPAPPEPQPVETPRPAETVPPPAASPPPVAPQPSASPIPSVVLPPTPPVGLIADTVELPGAPPPPAPPAATGAQNPPLTAPPTSMASPPLLATPAAATPPAPAPGVHPPVPAAALDPPEPQEPKGPKTSFFKKEISFGRKNKKDKQPKAERKLKPSSGRSELKPAKKVREPKRRKSDSGSSKRVRKLVGLKLGASQIAAARVVNNGSPELVQVAREELEAGVIVGGELREPEILAGALKDFFRKNKLPRQNVRLGIANNRIGVRVFEIAGVDDPKQLENAIRYRAQEVLPIPMEEAVLDYHVLSESTDAEGATTRRILLVVVAIGHDRSTFAVSDGETCEFTRVLDWGGHALDVAIARSLDVTPSEAEPIKRALTLGDHAPLIEGLTEEQTRETREAVRRQLQAFARELVSSLQFYQNQPGSLGIGEIVLTGGTAHLEGLGGELQKLIGVAVRVGDPLGRVKVGKRIKDREQIGSLAVAIGLGIED